MRCHYSLVLITTYELRYTNTYHCYWLWSRCQRVNNIISCMRFWAFLLFIRFYFLFFLVEFGCKFAKFVIPFELSSLDALRNDVFPKFSLKIWYFIQILFAYLFVTKAIVKIENVLIVFQWKLVVSQIILLKKKIKWVLAKYLLNIA